MQFSNIFGCLLYLYTVDALDKTYSKFSIEDVERGVELSFSGRADPPLHHRQIFHQNVLVFLVSDRTDRRTDGRTDGQTQ